MNEFHSILRTSNNLKGERVCSFPIMFSSPMMIANFQGTKSVTRRGIGLNEVNQEPEKWEKVGMEYTSEGGRPVCHVLFNGGAAGEKRIKCPYGFPGAYLWVRENHSIYQYLGTDMVFYQADSKYFEIAYNPKTTWRPSIHMPRWASRMLLKVSHIDCHRIKNITDYDCRAEGIMRNNFGQFKLYNTDNGWTDSPKASFISLWEKINGPWENDREMFVWAIRYSIEYVTQDVNYLWHSGLINPATAPKIWNHD